MGYIILDVNQNHKNIVQLNESVNTINGEIDVTFTARIMLSIINEVGSLGVISAAIGDYGGNITNLNLTEKDTDFYNLRIDIDVDDKSHIDNIIKSLRGLPEVNSVERSIH